MPKAMQGYNKLVNRDKVFAMLLSVGTPMNLAGYKLLTPKNIPNVSPLSAAKQLLEGPIRLRFLGSSTYYDQMRLGTRYMAEQQGVANVCAMYIPSDFGKEVRAAVSDEADANAALRYVAETTHRPDDADFVGSLQKLAASGCEMIALALGIRQTITVMGTSKKLGLADRRFIGSSAAFHTVLAQVPGGVTEGLFVAAGWADLAARADQEVPAAFIAAYMKAHGEFPGTGALLGFSAATGFTRALEKAGRDLNVDSFLSAMESLDYDDPHHGRSRRLLGRRPSGCRRDCPFGHRGRWMEGARAARIGPPGGRRDSRRGVRDGVPAQNPQLSRSRKWAWAAATNRSRFDCQASTRTFATLRPWRTMAPWANVSASRHGRR